MHQDRPDGPQPETRDGSADRGDGADRETHGPGGLDADEVDAQLLLRTSRRTIAALRRQVLELLHNEQSVQRRDEHVGDAEHAGDAGD